MMGCQIHIAECRTIGTQFVGHYLRSCEPMLFQKFAHRFPRSLLISTRLNQNVQDPAFTINGTVARGVVKGDGIPLDHPGRD